MPRGRGVNNSAAAAIGLSLLTLLVFFLLQNFGPESAVRRLHHAVELSDTQEVARVTLPSTTENLVVVINYLKLLDSQGAYMRMGRVQRSEGRALQEVQYVLADRYYTAIWVVDRKPSGWLININETAKNIKSPLG